MQKNQIKKNQIKADPVLTVAWCLAVLSALVVHPDKAYVGYIDWRSLGILWSLMVIIQGFRDQGMFDRIGESLLGKVKKGWHLAAVLVFLCFFGSMLITNDVALLTFVPFAILVLENCDRRDLMIPVIVLQTVAANLGSMLTPIGNPQNLYLFGLSGMGIGEFLIYMLPYAAASGGLLVIGLLFLPEKNAELRRTGAAAEERGTAEESDAAEERGTAEGSDAAEERSIAEGSDAAEERGTAEKRSAAEERGTAEERGSSGEKSKAGAPGQTNQASLIRIGIYAVLFGAAILTVLRMLPWYILVIAVLGSVGIMERKILARADYQLLLSFVGFFIFTGNMARIPAVGNALHSLVAGREMIVAVVASQFISNVPAALLLSGFTRDYRDLLLGVNIGGLGTLIASMASLISFKAYSNAYREGRGKYLKVFTVVNLMSLVVLAGLYVAL